MTPAQRITTAVAAVPEKINAWLATLPSTNARIVVTLAITVGTAVRFWWKGAPATGWGEWLMFLAAMSGIDVAQFAFKRKTHGAKPPAGDVP